MSFQFDSSPILTLLPFTHISYDLNTDNLVLTEQSPLTDTFLFYHHYSACKCIVTVWGSSPLVIPRGGESYTLL